jgi:hypothetical protein
LIFLGEIAIRRKIEESTDSDSVGDDDIEKIGGNVQVIQRAQRGCGRRGRRRGGGGGGRGHDGGALYGGSRHGISDEFRGSTRDRAASLVRGEYDSA